MNNELFLEHPKVTAHRKVQAWWENLWSARRLSNGPIREQRDAIIALQWLVAIGTSYLLFAVHDWDLTDPLRALLIILCLASAVILQRIPDAIFEKRLITPGLLILDSILIVSAMILREQTPWDLLLLFFFCVFISSMGENLIQVGIACVLLSLVFLMFASHSPSEGLIISLDLLIRIPFMFSISIFYGYMTIQVKQEKKRMEKMEEVVRLKRQLLSALAHDIKTPLNVILGHTELLADLYGGPQNPAERLSSLKRIRENIDHIVQLITEFLTISKLETIKLEPTRNLVHMNAIIENVVLQEMVTVREKNLRLTHHVASHLKPILGDENELRRALWNLVSNAIKFTPSGGNISISSRMIKDDVSIQVTDTGCGVPKEELSELFCEFKRLKRSANTDGTGLGLFIVKMIVEAHNGRIAVESEEGLGTTFTISLPACAQSSAHIQPVLANRAETAKLTERAA